MKYLKTVIIATFIAVVVCCAGFFVTVYYLNTPIKWATSEERVFSVQKGENLNTIAKRLADERFIRSSFLLKLISKVKGTQKKFKVGSYSIKPDTSTVTIHDLLVSGKQILLRATIPEGWTMSKIGGYLEKKGIVEKEAFMEACTDSELISSFGIAGDSVEGFLYPDTYLFPENYPPKEAVKTMISNFFRQIDAIYPAYRTLTQKQLYDRIILASIIEREYRVPAEAPRISSVFYNRIRINMALGSCATVEYIITEQLGKPHPEYLTQRDLEINSPYNTYLYPGLPPTPISNPGKIALSASFSPENTDLWYFVLKDPNTGEHYFSKNLNEHNKAKVFYLKKTTNGG